MLDTSVAFTLLGGLRERVSCCPTLVDAGFSSSLPVYPACSISSPADSASDFRAFFFEDADVPWVCRSRCFCAFRSSRSFFSLTLTPASAFSSFLAALAALRSLFSRFRSLRSSLVSTLSSDFRFLLCSVSPTCSGTGVDADEVRTDEGEGEGEDVDTSALPARRSGRSGPNTGPLKNRA